MNSVKDFEEYEEVQEEKEGEVEDEEEEQNAMNIASPGKNKQNVYDISPNGHWLVCGTIGADKTTLVKKFILNGVSNKKNIFWFHSHPNNDYIDQKECKKRGISVFGITAYSLGKNTLIFDTLLKDTFIFIYLFIYLFFIYSWYVYNSNNKYTNLIQLYKNKIKLIIK